MLFHLHTKIACNLIDLCFKWKQPCDAVLYSKVYKPGWLWGHMFGWYNMAQLHHDIAWVDAKKSVAIPWGNVGSGKENKCLFHPLFHLVPNSENKVPCFSEISWTSCDWTAHRLLLVPGSTYNVQGIIQVEEG